MKIINFFALIMVAVVVGFIGFCVENIWLAFSKGFMDNRNMCLPFLFGYGIAMMLVYFLFGLPHRPLFFGIEVKIKSSILKYIYYYVVMVICICVGEIVLGKTVEKCCGFQWWNYTWIPLHITQYTSIPTSMGFSGIVFLFMRYYFDWLMNVFLGLNEKTLVYMSLIFGLVLTLDMVYNLYLMHKNGKGTVRWRIEVKRH